MQADLFSEERDPRKLYRSDDPDTSREAAELVPVSLKQAAVYCYFREVRRATQLDVENYFKNHKSSYRSRVPELVEAGLLRYSGEKVEQAGRNRRIYELVPR